MRTRFRPVPAAACALAAVLAVPLCAQRPGPDLRDEATVVGSDAERYLRVLQVAGEKRFAASKRETIKLHVNRAALRVKLDAEALDSEKSLGARFCHAAWGRGPREARRRSD